MAKVTGDAGNSSPLFPDAKAGVWGESDTGYGVAGTSNGGNGVQGGSITGLGVVGTSSNKTGVVGITGKEIGVYGESDAPAGTAGIGVSGLSNAFGIYGRGTELNGVFGSGPNVGVGGFCSAPAGANQPGSGVAGFGGSGTSNTGVYANAGSGNAVVAESNSGTAVVATSKSGKAIHAVGNGICAEFYGGNVNIHTGDVNLGGTIYVDWDANIDGAVYASSLFCPLKLFRIDHPLDPANKYLQHATVESAERKNIYDGIVVLDSKGEATVVLPEWFEALNTEFRYQLTSIGVHATVYISQEVRDNRFRIGGGRRGMKVSWQLTGVRHDATARANPMIVEKKKTSAEKGKYIDAQAFRKGPRFAMSVNGKRPRSTKKEEKSKLSLRMPPIPKLPKLPGMAAEKRAMRRHVKS